MNDKTCEDCVFYHKSKTKHHVFQECLAGKTCYRFNAKACDLFNDKKDISTLVKRKR